MTLLILAYVGGVLTILSPCILPVLPFVLARADRPFKKNGLPMLCGMVLAFAAVATLAAVGGGWAVKANEYGRWAAMGLLVFFALTLMFTGLAEWLARPLVALGARISEAADKGASMESSAGPSVLLGAAMGLLWAPCAGPVLGLILTGAAIEGANIGTSLLLLAYAAGAATSLALALLLGGRVYAVMRRSLGVSQWARRAMGAAVLIGVALIATGLDTGLLSQLSLNSTTKVEQTLIDALKPEQDVSDRAVRSEGNVPSLSGAVGWINSQPLRSEDLRGKVVLVDFWTYSCINCLRTLPFVRAWADKYKDAGLVVIGVHSPEFAFEKNQDHVRRAVKDLKIAYPVAIDSDHTIWRAFGNQAWPALYFIDAQGRVRHHVFGEGQYDASERLIQKLLAENGKTLTSTDLVPATGTGVEAAPGNAIGSGETYVGHERAINFASPGGIAADRSHVYRPATRLKLNQWTLGGEWTVEPERAVASGAGARLAYRFRARDLHLVLGRSTDSKPVRFRVLIDGKPPMNDHGTDIDAEGNGVIDAHKLYQLVRLQSPGEHEVEIEFLDADAHVYAFTFG